MVGTTQCNRTLADCDCSEADFLASKLTLSEHHRSEVVVHVPTKAPFHSLTSHFLHL